MINLEKAATKIMAVIGTAVMLFLVFYSWRYTKILFSNEVFQNEKDSILWNLLLFVGTFVLTGVLATFLSRVPKGVMHVAAIVCSVVAVIFSLWLIRDARAYCVGDQYHSFLAAQALFNGDTEWMRDYHYFQMFPFQLGLSAIYSLFFRIAGQADWMILQNMQAICAGAILYAGYRIIRQLFQSRTAEAIYLILELLFAPLYCYTLFIYGETIGTCSAVLAIWFYLEANRTDRKKGSRLLFWVLTALMLSVMYLARSGLLVIWIAMVIMQLLVFCQNRNLKWFLTGVVALASVFLLSQFVYSTIEKQIGTKFDSGAPYILWIAMGMQEDVPERGPGAYNGYNEVTYGEVEGDTKAASDIAKEYLCERWGDWLHHPGQMISFFKDKSLFEWNDPTYGCFMMTCYMDEPEQWVNDCYNGSGYERIRGFLNRYQAMIYLAVLGYFVIIFTGKLRGVQILPGIILLGGFFFTMIWEAKSRYVYPYIVMILPCAAYSVVYYGSRMIESFEKLLHRRNKGDE